MFTDSQAKHNLYPEDRQDGVRTINPQHELDQMEDRQRIVERNTRALRIKEYLQKE